MVEGNIFSAAWKTARAIYLFDLDAITAGTTALVALTAGTGAAFFADFTDGGEAPRGGKFTSDGPCKTGRCAGECMCAGGGGIMCAGGGYP